MAIRFAKRCMRSRHLCTSSSSRPLSVCVVGSGPAGFYTAEKMLKLHKGTQVDILDRLPTPFGLVRTGVAPDHPETKNVINQFSRVATDERCSFFGNVSLGRSVSLLELRKIYDVVVLAYGSESDRVLGIPGEDLAGVHSAREFVWWYNGHPDYNNLMPDLSTTVTAVVLGQGNVALDVARILLRDTAELARTDIAQHALDALHQSSIRKVFLVGRRGPAQAACTAKELREILGLKNVQIHIKEEDLVKTPLDEEELKKSRIRNRVYDLLAKAASQKYLDTSYQRELHFVFFRKPDMFSACEGAHRVSSVRLEKTCLKENTATGQQSAAGTGEFEDIKTGLVLKSIGYKSVPVDGMPFNHNQGIVSNIKGRVLRDNQDIHVHEEGLYVVGWLKRGPTGIIGTNLYCAEETVASISEDLNQGKLALSSSDKCGRGGLLELLHKKSVKYITFKDWEHIDAVERAAGAVKNKPREKIVSWEELLKSANK